MRDFTLGFTGSSIKVTEAQEEQTRSFLFYKNPVRVRHGDYIGADQMCHNNVREVLPRTHIIIHPPDNNYKRAFCYSTEILEPKPYLQRNQDIVTFSDRLLAVVDTFEEKLRSGTWSTIRMARRKGIPIAIIYPNGLIKVEQEELTNG